MTQTAKRPTVVRLSQRAYEWLRDYAHTNHVTQSAVTEDALLDYLARKAEADD